MSKHIVEKPSLSINERLARYKQKLLKKNEKIASKILLKGDVVALPTENAPPNVMLIELNAYLVDCNNEYEEWCLKRERAQAIELGVEYDYGHIKKIFDIK